MKKNMGMLDRGIRVVVAATFLLLVALGVVNGFVGYVLVALAAVFLLTSLVSFCPLYTLVGFNSCPANK
jgi:hypothetical protein